MTPIFAYGTLMDREIMADVCGEHYHGTPGTLEGFKRRRVLDAMFPAITPDPTESVSGLLYPAVSDQALARLDRFEGELYQRRAVSLIHPETGEHYSTQAYVIKAEHQHRLSTEAWTLDWFLEQGKPSFVQYYRGFRDR